MTISIVMTKLTFFFKEMNDVIVLKIKHNSLLSLLA